MFYEYITLLLKGWRLKVKGLLTVESALRLSSQFTGTPLK